MVRSLQNYASPLIFFAMAEVAKDVPNKRYYIEKLQSLYRSVIDSHIENSKNWNCEFSCAALRRCDDVLYNSVFYINSQ